jgi:hypothetical protein
VLILSLSLSLSLFSPSLPLSLWVRLIVEWCAPTLVTERWLVRITHWSVTILFRTWG